MKTRNYWINNKGIKGVECFLAQMIDNYHMNHRITNDRSSIHQKIQLKFFRR